MVYWVVTNNELVRYYLTSEDFRRDAKIAKEMDGDVEIDWSQFDRPTFTEGSAEVTPVPVATIVPSNPPTTWAEHTASTGIGTGRR